MWAKACPPPLESAPSAAVTVLEVIQRSTEYLAKRGVDSPRLTIELLLAHVLHLPRLQLYLQFERVLGDAERDALRELVRRRGNREPLQHLTGTAAFCGLEFTVNRDVLIPRPETELLAERAWKFLQSRAGDASPDPAPAALDFGTGCGCLAITLAVKCPTAHIAALELSPPALAVAQANAARHAVADRIRFHAGDGFAALHPALRFDLIVANPPYIPTADIDALEPEVRDHDPRLALDGGRDGLDLFRHLQAEARGFLRPGGCLIAEFGDGQATAIGELFGTGGWSVGEIATDDTGRARILIAHPQRS